MTLRERLSAALSELSAALMAMFPAPAPVPAPTPVPTPAPVPTTGHPRIMLGTQATRLKAGLAIPTPSALRWRAACDRWLGGADLWGFEAWNGALLSQLTGDSRYAARAVATIDAEVMAAEEMIAAGQQPNAAGMVAYDSYLYVGGLIGDLALVYDWCYAQTTPAQRTRWIAYANQAVWNVWHHATASWGIVGGVVGSGKLFPWTGWAVNDSSNNYYYSFLRATMLLGLATQGENPAAAGWLTQFRDVKVLGQLVPEFNAELVGGGSREGTGYGVAMRGLFELYYLWQTSTGENLADKTPHTRASLLTMLASWVPTLDFKAPMGDQSRDSTAALFDYERAYILILCALYPTAPESARAVTLLAMSSVPSMQNTFMLGYDFIYASTMPAVVRDLPLVRHCPGIGQIYARSSWSKTATWLNLIAGPFTQSHAHQDQGSLMIHNGAWLAYDAVIESRGGVRQTGSLVGTPDAHSLVRISAGGTTIEQRERTTSQVLALHAGPGYVFACVDVTAAYAGIAAVALVRRQVLWLKPDVIVVHDRVNTVTGTTQTWQLVVPTQPVISGPAATIVNGAHTMRVTRVAPAAASWTATGLPAINGDFDGGFRLDQVQPGGDRTYVTVITLDGAAAPASLPTFVDVGCTFQLAGQTITLGDGVDAL